MTAPEIEGYDLIPGSALGLVYSNRETISTPYEPKVEVYNILKLHRQRDILGEDISDFVIKVINDSDSKKRFEEIRNKGRVKDPLRIFSREQREMIRILISSMPSEVIENLMYGAEEELTFLKRHTNSVYADMAIQELNEIRWFTPLLEINYLTMRSEEIDTRRSNKLITDSGFYKSLIDDHMRLKMDYATEYTRIRLPARGSLPRKKSIDFLVKNGAHESDLFFANMQRFNRKHAQKAVDLAYSAIPNRGCLKNIPEITDALLADYTIKILMNMRTSLSVSANPQSLMNELQRRLQGMQGNNPLNNPMIMGILNKANRKGLN
ncbi:MAG TPA: hypothetical protein VJI75_03745 [Candidatus Nanoarchaeia archaeon]|nr:hypothetical protein [Candidatus Nanoarchaeia archaeon]